MLISYDSCFHIFKIILINIGLDVDYDDYDNHSMLIVIIKLFKGLYFTIIMKTFIMTSMFSEGF